jgi:hypothetical protein
VGRWRTKALLAGIAFVAAPAAIAAAVVQGSDSGSSAQRAATRHARLMPVGQDPLRVKGVGFVPRERVRLKVEGRPSGSRSVTAGSRGSFVISLPGMSTCGGVTLTAAGSRGSRASFNLSQFVCR